MKQGDDHGRGDGVNEQQSHPERQSALGDEALHDVEAVEVEHVREQRREQVERASHARIDIGQGDGEQHQQQGADRDRDPPEELGALGRARAEDQHCGRNRLQRRRQRPRLRRFDSASQMTELRAAELRCSRLALVTTAVLEHDKAVAVGLIFEPARTRNRGGVLLAVDRMQKNVADRSVEGIDAFDEHDQLGPFELLEQSRGQERELLARFELALVFEPALLRPGRQPQRKHGDRDQERAREPEDGLEPRRQSLARGKPDDHLAVAIPA